MYHLRGKKQTATLHFNANASTNGDAAAKQLIVTFSKFKKGEPTVRSLPNSANFRRFYAVR